MGHQVIDNPVLIIRFWMNPSFKGLVKNSNDKTEESKVPFETKDLSNSEKMQVNGYRKWRYKEEQTDERLQLDVYT